MSMQTNTREVPGDLFTDEVNRMLRDCAEAEPEKLPHQAYPIGAMPMVGGDYSLAADVVDHRARAVKIFNGVTEVWLPRSQIRRITKNHVIVSDWIVHRKGRYFLLLTNRSPAFTEWQKKQEEERAAVNQWQRSGGKGFGCQLDGTD